MKTKNIFLTAVLVCVTSGAFAQASTTAPTPLLTQSEDTLIRALQSNSSRKEKADACRELAVIGTSKAVPALVGLLADEELTHMARYALETIPGPGVDQALRGELTRLKGRPLVGVIGSLGVRKDPNAVKPLSSLLGETDPQVAQAGARALGNIGSAEAVQAIETALPKTAPANRLAFGEGLLRCAEALSARGKTREAIALYDRLRRLTDVPDPVRAGALRGAIVVRGKKGAGLLKESLATGDRILFNAAVRASLEMAGSEVTQILAARLARLWPENKITVIQALGSRGDVKALPALYTQAKTGAKTTRVAAIRAIAAIGHASLSVPVMVEFIQDSDREISQAALEGLAGITGWKADEAVLNLLKSPRADRRITGIDLIGRRRMVAAVPALLTAAADSDAKVRSSALQGLGKLGAPAEVPALIKLLLRSTDAQDLNGLAEALSSICTRAGSPASATEQIIGALSGAQPAQKGALLGVLGAVGGERSLASVRAGLNDPNAEVREAALRALADWPDSAAAPDLLQLVRATSSNERDVAFRGYVRLARESETKTAGKLKMLTEAATLATSTPEKKLVLAGLGDILTVESLRLVTPHLSDPAVADEAGAVAVKIAEKLDAKDSADIGTSLNQVLKSAKSPQVLDQARKRMDELKLPVQ